MMLPKLIFLAFLLICVEKGIIEIDNDLYELPNYYEIVSELLEKGNWNTALRVAIQGVVEPATETIDPRLGILAMEIAAQNEAENFYLNATHAYFLSLRAADFNHYSELIENQILYIFPLLTDEKKEHFKAKLDRKDPTVISDYIGFWKKNDPFPSTGINERFIEHWLRIQYARANFNRASNTVYGTDDRGIVYVRFGKPARKTNETIVINSVSDPVTGAVQNLHPPQIVNAEIWSYYHLHDEEQLYIFGNRLGVGSFGLRKSIFEVLPVGAIAELESAPVSTTGEVNLRNTVRFVVQLGLLENLARTQPYFSEVYDEYSSEIIRASSGITGASFQFAARMFGDSFVFREEMRAERREREIPPTTSYLLHRGNSILSEGKRFNFFDEYGGQEIFLVTMNQHKFLDIDPDQTKLRGRLHVYEYDADWNLMNVTGQETDIQKDYSMFSLEISPEKSIHLSYSLEVFMESELDTTYRIIASTGMREVDNHVSDGFSESQFRVSDVVLGQVNPVGDGRAVVTPSFDREFSGNEELGVYFEVFSDTDEYTVSYRFERKNFFGLWREVDDRFSVSLDYQKYEKRAQNWFEFSLLELSPADYRMIMKFESPESEPIFIKKDFKVI